MRARLLLLAAVLVGCSDPAVSDHSGDASTTDSGVGPEVAPADGAPADGAPADTAVPKLPLCQQSCTKPADCTAVTTTGAFDATHYACESGVCRYLGCKTDAECTAGFGGTKPYKCRSFVGGVATCLAACTKPADCAIASAAYDADNYACTDGACEWKGCNDDAECKSSLSKTNTACRAFGTLKLCVTTCTAPADCATSPGAFDADNYSCDGGVCQYLGCKTDAECTETFKKTGYVCR